MMESEPWMTMDKMLKEIPEDPTIITKIVGKESSTNNINVLNLAMLGCETKVPYGPLDHTAQLLIELICMSIEKCYNINTTTNNNTDTCYMVRMKIYNVQNFEYPNDENEWDIYDGFIIPGSFSSAYDNDAWITQLKNVIQTEIVLKQRKTLAICFGHQIFAHSFNNSGGNAIKTPTGARAGRYVMTLTMNGQQMLLSNDNNDNNIEGNVNLFYTHGDMVEQLPDCACNLGGGDEHNVPIQAAAYFNTKQELDEWSNSNGNCKARPYAITLQAHPEYATSIDLGIYRTLHLCIDAMERLGSISNETKMNAIQDASIHFNKVQNDSIHIMIQVGKLLGWFT